MTDDKRSSNATCTHERVAPEVCDQTLGVKCLDCLELLGCCWADEHVSEAVWNRACLNDSEANPCVQSRDDVCFLCEEPIKSAETRSSEAWRAYPIPECCIFGRCDGEGCACPCHPVASRSNEVKAPARKAEINEPCKLACADCETYCHCAADPRAQEAKCESEPSPRVDYSRSLTVKEVVDGLIEDGYVHAAAAVWGRHGKRSKVQRTDKATCTAESNGGTGPQIHTGKDKG